MSIIVVLIMKIEWFWSGAVVGISSLLQCIGRPVGPKHLNNHPCAAVGPIFQHGPLTTYVKLRVAHAPGMPGAFSPTPWVSDPDMHHGTCVTHVPWCMPGSLCCGFLWSRWRGKRSRHSRRMRNPQFYVSGKRPMAPAKNHTILWLIPCLCHTMTRNAAHHIRISVDRLMYSGPQHSFD